MESANLEYLCIISTETFNLDKLKELYSDWDSVSLSPFIEQYPVTSESILEDVQELTDLAGRLSPELMITNATVYGFEDQKWQYWSAPNGTAECDQCTYQKDGKQIAERYYGGFSCRLRALEAQVNLTVDGQEKLCRLVGVPLKKNSVSHHSLEGRRRVYDRLDYFRLFFDIAFIESPKIGLEIKNWSLAEDWSLENETRYHLETMKDNETWPVYETRYHSPLFSLYLEPSCLSLSYNKARVLNRALSERLDHHVSELIAETMKIHFVSRLGLPYENSKIGDSEDDTEAVAAVQGLTGFKPKTTTKKPKPKPKPSKPPKNECKSVPCSNCGALNRQPSLTKKEKLNKALCKGGKAILKGFAVACVSAGCTALLGWFSFHCTLDWSNKRVQNKIAFLHK